jgi:type IV pilus assembly protein PilB
MSAKKRLGELLIEAGAIDEAMLHSALGHQRRWGGKLGHALLDLKLTSEAAIVEALGRKLGFEVARLGALESIQLEAALKLVGKDFATRHGVFPMAADHHTLTVAMSDPTNLAISDELRFRTNKRVKVCIGGDREIAAAIRVHYPSGETQQLEAISLDSEVSGEFLPPLADPFGGGSSDVLDRQMQRGPRPSSGRGEAPSDSVKEARATLFGAVPRGGFTQGDRVEDLALTPLPLPSAAASRPAPAPRPPPPGARPPPVLGPPPPPAPAPVPTPAPRTSLAPATTRPSSPAPRTTPAPAATRPSSPAPPPATLPPGVEAVFEEELVEGPVPLRPLTPKEVVILDALDRLAAGQDEVPLPVKPSQVAAALLRILLRRKLVSQQELLDELLRK